MLWRFITHNRYVIGFLSIFIFLVSGCSDNKDSAKNPAEGSVETTLVDFGGGPYRARLLQGWSSDEKWPDGTTVIWSNGGFSKMDIVVSEVADKEVILRSLPFDYPGAPQQTIKVSTIPDQVIEGDETFFVFLFGTIIRWPLLYG